MVGAAVISIVGVAVGSFVGSFVGVGVAVGAAVALTVGIAVLCALFFCESVDAVKALGAAVVTLVTFSFALSLSAAEERENRYTKNNTSTSSTSAVSSSIFLYRFFIRSHSGRCFDQFCFCPFIQMSPMPIVT